MILAHPGHPVTPANLWTEFNLDPVLMAGLVAAGLAYWAGWLRSRRRSGHGFRGGCFAGALATVAVALVSPLDALSGSLASAHMLQHLLLLLVAAPLFALSAPQVTLLRATPATVRREVGRWRGRLGFGRLTRLVRHPVFVWLLYVATLWFWHSRVAYDAALDHEFIHVVEHASFLVTGGLFWALIIRCARSDRISLGAGPRASRLSPGLGVLLLFATTMQGVFLSALLTFAPAPWYSGYAASTQAWNLGQLADQQLAGVLMWVPAGLVYLISAMLLLARWLRDNSDPAPSAGPAPPPTTARVSASSPR